MHNLKQHLNNVNAASLVDAMGRVFNHRAHILDLKSPTPGKILFGPAAIIAYMPYRQDVYVPEVHNFARLFYEAVGNERSGKVLVLASNGHHNSSLGGGTKLSRVHNHGLAGILADGRLRDFEELSSYNFVTYCTGQTTRWGGDEVMPFAANVPSCVAGVCVVPGDFVYADDAGAVILPAKKIEQVFEEAVNIEKADMQFIDEIRRENPGDIMTMGSREI